MFRSHCIIRCGEVLLTIRCMQLTKHSPAISKGFRSRYSLENIYPNSSFNFSQIQVPENKDGEFCGYIPIDELQVKYTRSSGPGGQNVNKVNTKVEVRFHLPTAKWIPDNARKRMLELQQNNLTKDGYFIIKSDKTRMQQLNLADCMDKIRCLVREAAKPPPDILPETKAALKKRFEKAAAERLRQKRIHSTIKRARQEIDF